MAFAGGMTVFPGGGVDASDRPAPDRWAGPNPQLVGRAVAGATPTWPAPSCRPRSGRRSRSAGCCWPGRHPAGLHRHRADVVARRRTLTDVLAAEAGWCCAPTCCAAGRAGSRPMATPRRYDTAFFVALVPDGQEADAHTTEAVEAPGGTRRGAGALAARRDAADAADARAPCRRSPGTRDSAAVLAAARRTGDPADRAGGAPGRRPARLPFCPTTPTYPAVGLARLPAHDPARVRRAAAGHTAGGGAARREPVADDAGGHEHVGAAGSRRGGVRGRRPR